MPAIIFWRERVMTMTERIFFTAGNSPSMEYAVKELKNRGMTFAQRPTKAVTHLLLPAPCREDVSDTLKKLSLDVKVLGGGLNRPELWGYHCMDLLEDEIYLAANARITAHCALRIAAERIPVTWDHCPVLVIGWGRIGKCLAALLSANGADVTVAARKEKDRAMIRALGMDSEDPQNLSFLLKRYRVLINTVPCPVLTEQQVLHCRTDCVKIDLASVKGIPGDDVIEARGLPGKYAPETAGKLIARTALRLCAQQEVEK